VCFERTDAEQEILSPEDLGACGWLAAYADSQDMADSRISRALKADGVRVVSFNHAREVFDIDEILEIDEHLARNIETIGPEQTVAWGTIHCYYAEGEA